MKHYKQNRLATRRVDGSAKKDEKTSARVDNGSTPAVSSRPSSGAATPMHKQRTRRVPPFWIEGPHRDHDLARLMPSTLRKGKRFETIPDVEGYRDKNIRALNRVGGFEDVVVSMMACSAGEPCAKILCSVCGRGYRRWLGGQALPIVKNTHAKVVTILLQEVAAQDLPYVDVDVLHECLRKRLKRAGITAAIGGTEQTYVAAREVWVVHVHLLVFGESDAARHRLGTMMRKDGIDRPIKWQPLKDPVEQTSYIQKFPTYHRPGKPGARGKGTAYPLAPVQIGQLASWTSQYQFHDFLFLLGFRRRGSTIVPTPATDALLRRARLLRR
jgi:hypothetical protein